MPRSQTTGRVLSTRRAHRPDGRVYRMMRLRRGSGRRGRNVGLAVAVVLFVAAAMGIWLVFWR